MDQTGTLNFNGTAVSLSGHTHTFDSLTSKPTTLSGYGITDAEPAFTKNTGFNKNFGTTSGTVSEGDHTHSQYLLDTGDTLSGQLLMNAVSPTGTTSDSQQILFRGRALGGNVDRALKINSLGTLLFNGTEVSLSGHTHSYLPLSGGTVTGDLTLERDGSTSVGSHGIVFQYNNGSSTLTRELNVNSVGTLNFNGTAVSLSGHTHSYLPLSGGTLTGDLTMQPVGPTASSSESESIVFVSRAINTDISTAIYTNSAGNLTVGGTEVSLSGHNHSASNITSGTLTVARGGTGASTLTSGEVLIGAGTAAVTTLSRSGIDSRTEFPPSSHEHSGSDITSGTVDGARLPTNTVIGTTFSGA